MTATLEPGLGGPLVAGVDVGGTKASVVVTDDRDRILYEHVAPTDPSALVGQIAGLVEDARRHLGRDVAAVGVAIPGHVDPEDGSVSMAVNLGITHLPLGVLLQRELGVPVFVEHDARAAALWLSQQPADGLAPVPASVAFLAIGTGISAGIAVDGALLRGDNHLAGEVGHVVADPLGTLCACGLRGCLETIAAGPAIARQAAEAIASGRIDRPGARFHGRGCVPGRDGRRRRRDRDRRPGGRPPGPGDRLARPDGRRQASRHRRRRGGRRTGPSRSIRSRIARDRAASPLVRAALGDATVELLSPTEAPGARGAAAFARHRIGLPEREGVGER